MKLKILPRAKKRLKRLSKVDQIAVANKIRSLVNNGASQEKLSGYRDVYRVRVGDCRIVFKKSKKELYIIMIGHRKDVYQVLKRLLN